MSFSFRTTLQPAVEPVTIREAKAQCRISPDDDSEDLLLAKYIKAAREHAQKQLGRAIIQQTVMFTRDRFPGQFRVGHDFGPRASMWDNSMFGRSRTMLLPWPNLLGIVSVTYLDPTGTRQTLDPSLYSVDSDSMPGSISPAPGSWWPATAWGRTDAVQVTYMAGYGLSPDDVPATVQLAILGLVGHWFENRESVVLTNSPNAVTIVPQFVDELLETEAAPTVFDWEA